jgi:hypothetical protein
VAQEEKATQGNSAAGSQQFPVNCAPKPTDVEFDI